MLYIMINWIKHNIFYLFFIFDYEKKIEIKICSFAKCKFIMKGQGVISFTNLLKKIGVGGRFNIISIAVFRLFQDLLHY